MKAKTLDSRSKMSGMTDAGKFERVLCSSYSLRNGLDLHGKLQADALQHGLKGGKARIALAGQRSVQALAAQVGILSKLSHASGPGDVAEGQ